MAGDEELRSAVEAAVRAGQETFGLQTQVVVGEFVVIASAHGFNEEGMTVTQVAVIPVDGSEHRILGLIEHARIRMKADVLEGYEE